MYQQRIINIHIINTLLFIMVTEHVTALMTEHR